MSWVQQQPVPPPPPSSQPPQLTTSSTLLPSTGASMRSHVSSSATISSTLNTSTKPQPHNLAHTNNNQLSRHPWQQQQQHSSMMQPTPNPPVNNYNAAQMNKWPQQQQNIAGSSANMYQPIAGNNWMQTDLSVSSQTHLQQPPNQQHQLNQQHYQQNQSMQQQHQPLQQQHHQQQHQQTLQQQHQQNHQQQQQDLQQTSKFSYFSQAPQNDNNFMQQQPNANVSAFSNYQQQPIAHPQPPILAQQQQQPPPIQQPPIHPPSHHLLHSTHASQQQQEEHVQNIINNNDGSKNDGWADWDWNDNGVINTGIDAVEQLTTHAQLEQQSMTTQMDSQQQQQNHYNANFIEDSFRSESNDNWHWGSSNQTHANAVEQNLQPLPKAPAAVAPAAPSVAPSVTSAVPSVAPAIPLLGQAAPSVASTTLLNPTQSQQFQQPQVPTPIAQSSTITTQQHFAEFSVATAKPASLPLPAVAAAAELNLTANNLHARPETNSEHSINAFGAATPAASTTTTTSNIPNSVYVSQAKPVTKPSRQYASPPVTSPVTEVAELSALSPPHAFQNEINAEPAIAPVTNLAPHVESTANMPPHVAPAASNLAPQVPLPPATTPLVPQPATTATIPTAAVQPPPAMTPPTAALIPPVGINKATAGNPFKRAGAAQHHRGTFIPTNSNNNAQPLAPMAAMNFVVPPPPADFATPMQQQPLIGENVEPDNSEILHENQEVIVPASAEVPNLTLSHTTTAPAQLAPIQTPPNDERNQYLQTSHLSENLDEELNIEMDNFPPPGLSRLVLGQPEYEASQRMVTGTEQDMDNFNIDERHADGEDTSLEPIVPAMANNTATNVSSSSNNIDITTDRNLYLVAGESGARDEPRVVTGVERVIDPPPASQIINEQREIELDGENLEDQQQLQQPPPPPPATVSTVASRNEPPLEGAVANSIASPPTTVVMTTHPIDTSHKQGSAKDHSNISTGNDESEPIHEQHRYTSKSTRNRHEASTLEKKLTEKQRKEKQRSVDRYASDDSEDEYPSEHERERRRRDYREGSARSDRGGIERDLKEKKNRRELRADYIGADRERDREKHHNHHRAGEGGERSEGFGGKSERRSQRYHRYEADSKYETEESTRHEAVSRKERRSGRNERERGERDRDRVEERSGRSDRSDRDYDDYRRYHHGNSKREGKRGDDRDERRDRRDVYAEDERRRRAMGGGGGGGRRGDKDYRGEYENTLERRSNRRSDKHRVGAAVDPSEYEEYRKQSSRNARESDLDKDRRNATRGGFDARHAGMYAGYPSTAYGYDPYTYYYEQMARTNPQAYAEWYKKYYGHAAAATLHGHDQLQAGSAAATDGRESVHSGRSSANNENDRLTQAYISQANDYHRHFMQHHHHQQQQQQQQKFAHNMSHTMNSTMLEESAIGAGSQSNQNYPLYGRLSRGHSTGNLSQIQAATAAASYYAGGGGGGGSTAHLDYGYYARSEYADSRSGNLSLRETTEPQRLTPCKFVNDHAVVSFSAGLLITVKPKYTPHGVSNIVKLLRLGPNDSTRQLFQAFPGPLVRGLTHKKTVIEFCEEQIQLGPQNTTIYAKQLLSSNMEKFKASYTLMWNLLILLLRQNGMVVGTDIAELLLKNQVQFPYNPQSNTPNSTASNSLKTGPKSESDSIEDADMKDSDIECDAIEPAAPPAVKSSITVTEDNVQNGDDSIASVSKSNTASTSCSSEEEITAKFRNFLLYGNVNEALDWATDNNLWGHALFLASKVDRRSHANVMMKFANKLSLNDPLQTLYQLMSGRTPSSVTSVQDEKWGDWRPHLSMILSNTSQKPELDRKAITTLGDSLFNRGDLYAAHFCYLMAQVSFGRYQDSATQETALQQSLPKLVLLGSSHYKFFKDFASNDAIIMTEIYEYACSLNDEKFSLVEFQPYKYLLATRMLDYGYQLKSLMYLEQISLHIERDPSKYEPSFINKVYEFADRLKFYDPVLEKSMDDPQNVEGNFNSAAPNFEEQKWLQNLRSIAVQYKPDYGYIATAPSNTNAIDENLQLDYQKQFAEINKQFSELNMQYNSNNIGVATEGIGYNTNSLQQQTVPQSDNIDMYTQQQQQQQLSEQQQQQQHLQQQSVMTNNTDYSNLYGQPMVYGSETQGQSQDVAADNYAAAAAAYGQQPQFYDPNQQQQQQQQQQTEFNASSDVQQNNASYDYWAGQQLSQQLPGNEELNAKEETDIENLPKTATTNSPTFATIASAAAEAAITSLHSKQIGTKPDDSPSKIVKNSIKSTTTKLTTLDRYEVRPAKFNYNNRIGKSYQTTTMAGNNATTAAAKFKLQQSYKAAATEDANARATATVDSNSSATTTQATHSSSPPFQLNADNARPTISMPNSKKSYDSNVGDEQKPPKQEQENTNNSKKNKNDGKDAKSSQPASNQNSGWFGGIWNKLSLKPKNQMILPDDKNPTIVWDAEKKRWVNTDGGDDGGADAIKPPPKMGELMSQQQQQPPQQQQQQPMQPQQQQQQMPMPQQQQQMPTAPIQFEQLNQYGVNTAPQQQQQSQQQQQQQLPAGIVNPIQTYSAIGATTAPATSAANTAEPTKPPSLQSNMFKMQRNRTLKNSYVDVFNPSGAPMSKAAENVLAPALPPAAVPQGGFFIPGAPPNASNDAAGAYQQEQPAQDLPQFYNPNQFGAATGNSY